MKYEEQERKIYAKYDDKTIRVYQAYNNVIADEAIKLGTFGEHFSLTRMTWIKPSFLWMMYRCGWAEKENQERVLAIDIKREAFDEIGIAKKRFGEILYKITEKVMYHMIQQKYKNKGKLNRHDFTDKDMEEQD